MKFTESTVEDAVRSRLGELQYSVLHGPEIGPEEAAAERKGFAEVVLPERVSVVSQRVLERP